MLKLCVKSWFVCFDDKCLIPLAGPWEPKLPIRSPGKEAKQSFKSGICVLVDVFRHGVIHKRCVFVSDQAAAVSDLGYKARTFAVIGTASVPYLVVEHYDTSCFPQIVSDLI